MADRSIVRWPRAHRRPSATSMCMTQLVYCALCIMSVSFIEVLLAVVMPQGCSMPSHEQTMSG